ncbi:MAG: hypothetical protein ACRDR6_25250 [Pseudonocardiaceae bacterium]
MLSDPGAMGRIGPRVSIPIPAADALLALPSLLHEAALDALTVLESDPEAGNALRGRLRGVRSLVRVRAIRHRSVAHLIDHR